MRKHPWNVGAAAMKACALALALFALTHPAAAQPIARWQPLMAEASVRFGIPVAWIERVMRAESGGRTTLGGRPIVSRAGAMGLMQLMPGTWGEMRAAYGLGQDPHDPRDNILAGSAYLRRMYDRFGYPGMFAAYNAGPARYADHLATDRPLPAETRAYLAGVTMARDLSKADGLKSPRPSLFMIKYAPTVPPQILSPPGLQRPQMPLMIDAARLLFVPLSGR